MSTRSAIIAHLPATNIYRGIYCHNDGYIDAPHGVGHVLHTHFRDRAKVEQLIALGDISSLGAEIGEKHNFNENRDGVCRAYHRDHGDDFNVADGPTWAEVAAQIGHNGYVYVFENDRWLVSVAGTRLTPLADHFIEAAPAAAR